MKNLTLKTRDSKLTCKAFTLVDPGSESGVTSLHKGFTLVELMIVVAVLGILAAIVIPEFSGHIQRAKEAAAKDNLRVLRETIERYAHDHNGVPPGYPGDDPSTNPGSHAISMHFVGGGYLSELPENPFNGKRTFNLIGNGDTFPTEAALTDNFGWVYQPVTKTIKLNTSGVDSSGVSFFDY